MPETQTRNNLRISVTMSPVDLIKLEALADRQFEGNRSLALRHIVREYFRIQKEKKRELAGTNQ